jgi:hypothetical protein
MTGLVQSAVAPSIYKVHVPLNLAELRAAHVAAGLEMIEADYLLPVGFGVVNYLEPQSGEIRRFANRAVGFALARLSWGAWFVDSRIRALPKTNLFSPYIYCIARRPQATPVS